MMYANMYEGPRKVVAHRKLNSYSKSIVQSLNFPVTLIITYELMRAKWAESIMTKRIIIMNEGNS